MSSSRALLKRTYFSVMAAMGRERRLLDEIRRARSLVVLNFHRISPTPNPFWAPIHPVLFERLLVFLRERFEIVPFREVSTVASDRPIAVISFDDGYYDFVEYAMPLLDRHGIRVNQNVIPSCVESGRAPWNVALVDFLNEAPRTLINELKLPGFNARLDGDDDDAKTRFGVALSAFLKKRPRSERQHLWPAVAGLMARMPNGTPTRMMSDADVRAAAAQHEIGAHSYSHESMEYEPLDFFEEDFARCADFFRSRLHVPLTVYAFPNGSYREEHIAALRQRGVQRILLVGERFAERDADVCPRFTMYGDSLHELTFRSLGFFAAGGAAAGSVQ